MANRDVTRRTFFYEKWRASAAGILETAATTFLLVLAVRVYEAGWLAKAIVAGSGSLGLLLTPVVVSVVTAGKWPTSKAAAIILAFGSLCFLLASLFPSLQVFVLSSVVAMTCSSAVIPLLTQMYQENYPPQERGRMFARTVMIRIAAAAIFAKLAGDALDQDLGAYPWILVLFGVSLAGAAFCLSRCPTHPIESDGGAHPLRSLRYAQVDPLFRRVLISWMIMGFANLMMFPLRVEYLANPVYGWKISVGMVALLTAVIPNLARLIMSPFWGYLFDHMNFFTLRIILNIGFAVAILLFFVTESLWGLFVGAALFGIANAGGEVAWSLWVTKFAPPARVADYMSVHTSLTGIRGVLAPMCSFVLIGSVAMGSLALVSCGLILVGTSLLIPKIKSGRDSKRSSALVEEVTD